MYLSLFILKASDQPINLSLGAHLRAVDDQAIRATHLPLMIATYLCRGVLQYAPTGKGKGMVFPHIELP